jgi:glycerol uptake facilitator-like aquaporin
VSDSMARRLAAEALGTALLLIAVISSAILGDQLANGNVAIAVLVTTIATGTVLGAVIQSFRVVSGAHINPVVTLVEVLRGRMSRGEAAAYASAQIISALAGVAAVYAICAFSGLAVPHVITAEVTGVCFRACAQWRRPALERIRGDLRVGRSGPWVLAHAHRCAAACSRGIRCRRLLVHGLSSFANPAVTLTQAVLNTIPPLTALAFIVAQLVGGAASEVLFSWLLRVSSAETGLRRERKDWP